MMLNANDIDANTIDPKLTQDTLTAFASGDRLNGAQKRAAGKMSLNTLANASKIGTADGSSAQPPKIAADQNTKPQGPTDPMKSSTAPADTGTAASAAQRRTWFENHGDTVNSAVEGKKYEERTAKERAAANDKKATAAGQAAQYPKTAGTANPPGTTNASGQLQAIDPRLAGQEYAAKLKQDDGSVQFAIDMANLAGMAGMGEAKQGWAMEAQARQAKASAKTTAPTKPTQTTDGSAAIAASQMVSGPSIIKNDAQPIDGGPKPVIPPGTSGADLGNILAYFVDAAGLGLSARGGVNREGLAAKEIEKNQAIEIYQKQQEAEAEKQLKLLPAEVQAQISIARAQGDIDAENKIRIANGIAPIERETTKQAAQAQGAANVDYFNKTLPGQKQLIQESVKASTGNPDTWALSDW